MSSTKSSVGHLLGAAGAVEAIFSILAIRDAIVPPTLNLDNPSVETPIDLVPHEARRRKVNVVLVEFLRFRRNECVADFQSRPLRGRRAGGPERKAISLFRRNEC